MSWNEPYNHQEQHIIGTEGQRVITLTKKYRPNSGDLLIFLNGVLARVLEDYEEINNYTIKFKDGLSVNDIVLCQLIRR